MKNKNTNKIVCAVGVCSIRSVVTAASCLSEISVNNIEVVVHFTTKSPGTYKVHHYCTEEPIAVLFVSFLHIVEVFRLN